MTRSQSRTTARLSTVSLVVAMSFVVSLAPASPLGGAAQEMEEERYSAFATHLGTAEGRGPARPTTVQITISRWSTGEERMELLNLLKEEGHEEAADALRKHPKTGFIRFPGLQTRFPSTRLYYAHQFQQGDTRVVRLGTDRPIGFVEAVHRPRSIRYDLSLIELRLPASGDGNGEGALVVGAEITWDEEQQALSVEHFSTAPVRLTEVSRTR